MFLNLLDLEDIRVVRLFVEGEFPGLAERPVAARHLALVGPLTCMGVSVLLEVLGKRELLEADQADELLDNLVSHLMSLEREFGGEVFAAAIVLAEKLFDH